MQNAKLVLYKFKIGGDEIIFVRCKIAVKPRAEYASILCRGEAIKSPRRGIKATNPQHTMAYVRNLATDALVQKELIRTIFVRRYT